MIMSYFKMIMLTLSQILSSHEALHQGIHPLHAVHLRDRHRVHGGEAPAAASGAGPSGLPRRRQAPVVFHRRDGGDLATPTACGRPWGQ